MRILADENVPRAIVAWLRDTGHDVLYSAESRKQTPDANLLAEAEAQGYIVLTGEGVIALVPGIMRLFWRL